MLSLWINNSIINASLIILAFLTVLLVIFPELDIHFSELFFLEKMVLYTKKTF